MSLPGGPRFPGPALATVAGRTVSGAPNPRQTAPQSGGHPSPYNVPPAQGPKPISVPPAQGPRPYPVPPAQGPSPYGVQPAQGPSPYGVQPAQGPIYYGVPPAQGPRPYSYPPVQGPSPYGYPPVQGPSPYGYPPVQGPSPYGYPPVQGPSPYGYPPVPGHAPGHHASWMPAPATFPNCPPGLEYLTQIDQLIVHQQLELLEILLNFETNNKYEIKNSLGQRVYFAAEENDCLTLNCCGNIRAFTMRIYDNMGQVVIELHRPFRCDNCCYPCCLQELEVHAPPGRPVGYVKQLWDFCLPIFVVQNETRQDVLKIIGPCMVCSCGGDVNFEVTSLDQQHIVGRIGKHWTGLVKELFTDVDNFGIQFPMDLDVKMKAVMLGACFLIDYMFFESTAGSEESRGVWDI